MRTNACLIAVSICVIAFLYPGDGWVGAEAPGPAIHSPGAGPAPPPEQSVNTAKPRKQFERDGTLLRITGKAKVIDAHIIAFEDGTEVDLNGIMDAPDLEQKRVAGDSFLPWGKEAADFLTTLIGGQTVTFLSFGSKEPRPRGTCYAGETFVQEAMVRNGAAVSGHSTTELAQLIAQEHKRGVWPGKFITPKAWRKGERLPGE